MVTAQQFSFQPMNAEEARQKTDQIKKHLDSARLALLEVYQRDGHKALGYKSWAEYAKAELEISKSHLYRLLDAIDIEKDIQGTVGEIPERSLRPLKKVPAEMRAAVYSFAKSVSPRGEIKPAIVEAVVESLAETIKTGAYQDGDGEQHPLLGLLQADAIGRIYETKQRQKAILDSKRKYLVKAEPVCSVASLNGKTIITIDSNVKITDYNKARLSLWEDVSDE